MPPIVRALVLALSLTALSLPSHQAAAQGPPRYTLFDVGSLHGSTSAILLPAIFLAEQGIALGAAGTRIADADYPNFNPYIVGFPHSHLVHAIEWRRGRVTDLGALPGNNSSVLLAVNPRGVGVGMSETGAIDPHSEWPAEHAVLWRDGKIVNLGTLKGGYESQAMLIDSGGTVAGFASNGTPDVFSMGGWCTSMGMGCTQARAVVWRHGIIRDLGTLGGPDSFTTAMNERGQVTGPSYTTATRNQTTGMPTQDPFLWTNGTMQDLGTLGGTVGTSTAINAAGTVVGQSNLAGDQSFHPFVWQGGRMRDLGTFGGTFGAAMSLNEAGDAIGWATTPGDESTHAALWTHGTMIDLGTVSGQTCSVADGINSHDQVVGGSCADGSHGWLWEHGTLSDLNTLVGPSALHVSEAHSISDQGEILATGVLPNGDEHTVLLLPTAEAARYGLIRGKRRDREHGPMAPSIHTSAANPQSARNTAGLR